MYKLNRFGGILRLADNVAIPEASGNSDYRAYLEWVKEGNLPAPADIPSAAEENATTFNEIREMESASLRAIREFILGDATAKERLKVIDDQIAAKRTKLRK